MVKAFSKKIHLFIYWGVKFTEEIDDEYIGTCPFCLHDDTKTGRGHFFCNKYTRAWDCKACGSQGSWREFLKLIHEKHLKTTTDKDLMHFVNWKGIPLPVLKRWKLAKYSKKVFFLPVYSQNNNDVIDLRRFKLQNKQDKENVTSGCTSSLLGLKQLIDKKRSNEEVYLCEGTTDALMLDWLLRRTNMPGIVLNAPGANVFKVEWGPYFENCVVNICYDNDEVSYGELDLDRGKASGSRKVSAFIFNEAKQVNYLNWPNDYPDKFDVKDFIIASKSTPNSCYNNFRKLIKPYHKHDEDKQDNIPKPVNTKDNIKLSTLLEEAKKIYEVSKIFEIGIKLALATALAVKIPGNVNPWLFLMGPPACGKTLILSMLEKSTNCYWCSSMSSKALISGWGIGTNDFVDASLLGKVNNKCMIFKDYTEILSKPQQEKNEIFGILTGAFDGRARKILGTGEREYKCKFTMIAGVTYIILSPENNTTSLGDRFLKYDMSDPNIDEDKIMETALNLQLLGQNKDENLNKLTVSFLDNKYDFSGQSIMAKTPRWFIDRVKPLSMLTAKIRTIIALHEKGSKYGHLVYVPTPESGNRLYLQLVKLAQMLCLIEDRKEIDEDIYSIIKTVAMDTVKGFNRDIIFLLLRGKLLTQKEIIAKLHIGAVGGYLQELQQLGIMEESGKRKQEKRKQVKLYSLTKNVNDLCIRAKI